MSGVNYVIYIAMGVNALILLIALLLDTEHTLQPTRSAKISESAV